MTEDGQFVEIQGSGEESTFSEAQLNAMLGLGKKGIMEICKLQEEAIRAVEPQGAAAPAPGAMSSLAEAFKRL
jgi:ribonuclease PH